jgi:predicted DNA-binding transcriptional regulator YafY
VSFSTTERLLNLVLALLGSRYGRSREFLRTQVQGYDPGASEEAFGRMFERDKVKLKQLGIPVIAEKDPYADDENAWKYRIRPEDYRLPEVPLTPQGIAVLALAARVWEQASLGSAAARALRKVGTVSGGVGMDDDVEGPVQARILTKEPAFDALWDALLNHHPVRFSYRNAQAAQATERLVQPWGLGNKYGQWYLSGKDLNRGEQRLYRLSRISSEVVPLNETFEPPEDYDIGAALDALGTGPIHSAVIELPVGTAQALRESATNVAPARPGWDRVVLPFKEPELLAGQLAALGDGVLVLEPAPLRADVLRRLRGALDAARLPVVAADFSRPVPVRRAKTTSDDRLRRLLDLVPYLVHNNGIPAAEVATEFDITPKQLEDDLQLLTLCGLPGYQHGDLIDVQWDAGAVFIRDAEELARPLRLTQEEAAALLVGLESLQSLPDADGGKALADVLASVRGIAGDAAWVADVVEARIAPDTSLDTLSLLQRAAIDATAVHIRYAAPQRDEITDRVIEPLRVFSADSLWYVEAWCRLAQGLRNFRLDRIREAAPTGEPAQHSARTAPPLAPAAAFTPTEADPDVVLALDREAEWVADAYAAEQRTQLPDGRLAVRLRVRSHQLVTRLLAALGGTGQLLEPESRRAETVHWLTSALDLYAEVEPGSDATPQDQVVGPPKSDP